MRVLASWVVLSAAAGMLGTGCGQPTSGREPSGVSPSVGARIAAAATVRVRATVQGDLRRRDGGAAAGHVSAVVWGSGVLISHQGVLLTAAHVAAPGPEEALALLAQTAIGACLPACAVGPGELILAGAAAVSLVVYGPDQKPGTPGTGAPATLLAASPPTVGDVAVLQIPAAQLPARVAVHPVAAGDSLVIIGYPGAGELAGSSEAAAFTPTRVTSVRAATAADPLARQVQVIDTDSGVEDGVSGGPAVDPAGDVVGLVTHGTTSTTTLVEAADGVRMAGAEGVSVTATPVDGLWRAGVRADAAGDFAGALAALNGCIQANPAALPCASLAAVARDSAAGTSPPPEANGAAAGDAGPGGGAVPPPSKLLVGIELVASLTVLAVAGGWWLRRGRLPGSHRPRRRRARAQSPPPLPPLPPLPPPTRGSADPPGTARAVRGGEGGPGAPRGRPKATTGGPACPVCRGALGSAQTCPTCGYEPLRWH